MNTSGQYDAFLQLNGLKHKQVNLEEIESYCDAFLADITLYVTHSKYQQEWLQINVTPDDSGNFRIADVFPSDTELESRLFCFVTNGADKQNSTRCIGVQKIYESTPETISCDVVSTMCTAVKEFLKKFNMMEMEIGFMLKDIQSHGLNYDFDGHGLNFHKHNKLNYVNYSTNDKTLAIPEGKNFQTILDKNLVKLTKLLQKTHIHTHTFLAEVFLAIVLLVSLLDKKDPSDSASVTKFLALLEEKVDIFGQKIKRFVDFVELILMRSYIEDGFDILKVLQELEKKFMNQFLLGKDLFGSFIQNGHTKYVSLTEIQANNTECSYSIKIEQWDGKVYYLKVGESLPMEEKTLVVYLEKNTCDQKQEISLENYLGSLWNIIDFNWEISCTNGDNISTFFGLLMLAAVILMFVRKKFPELLKFFEKLYKKFVLAFQTLPAKVSIEAKLNKEALEKFETFWTKWTEDNSMIVIHLPKLKSDLLNLEHDYRSENVRTDIEMEVLDFDELKKSCALLAQNMETMIEANALNDEEFEQRTQRNRRSISEAHDFERETTLSRHGSLNNLNYEGATDLCKMSNLLRDYLSEGSEKMDVSPTNQETQEIDSQSTKMDLDVTINRMSINSSSFDNKVDAAKDVDRTTTGPTNERSKIDQQGADGTTGNGLDQPSKSPNQTAIKTPKPS
ncbi:hypothetical protein Ciccas_003071, partial [Cichlidogyrus casuarinus]